MSVQLLGFHIFTSLVYPQTQTVIPSVISLVPVDQLVQFDHYVSVYPSSDMSTLYP